MKKIAILTIFVLVFSVFGQIKPKQANAAGVTLYADLAADGNYNGSATSTGLVAYSTVTTEAEIALSSDSDVYFAFLADTSEFETGDTLTLTLPATWTAAACTTATTDADADQTADGSFGFVANVATYTFTATTTRATTEGVEFCVNVTTDGVAGNGVVTMVSSSETPQTSAVFIYNGDANNVVITAEVQTTLFFQIRTNDDATTTNACDLGVLDTGQVKECSYRLAIETAAASGFTAYIKDDAASTSAGLRNGNGDEINPVTNNFLVTAGQEDYGVAFTVASSTLTASSSAANPFDGNDTPIPTSKSAISSANAPYAWIEGDLTRSSLVTHRAAIDANTPAGSYTQTVAYYVTANY